MITKKNVAEKLLDYLHHTITITELVNWAETAFFEEDFDNVDPYAGYFHTTSMKLTAEKIREKIKERTSPFNQLES